MPPAALASSMASETAFLIGSPRNASSPVSGTSSPIFQVPGGNAAIAGVGVVERKMSATSTTIAASTASGIPASNARRAMGRCRLPGSAHGTDPGADSITAKRATGSAIPFS